MVVLRNTGCGVEEHRVWRGAPCLWIRPLRKSDPRPAAGADPATRRRAHEPGAGRRRQRSTMEEARFTIKLSGSLVQCSWFAGAAVSADIYELSMRCDVCSPCALAIGVRSLTKFTSRPLTTRTYQMRMCTDASALSRRGEAVHPGGACPVVRGDPCVCELCCVGQIACALPVWQVVLCMLPLYAVGGLEWCSQGEVERGARA